MIMSPQKNKLPLLFSICLCFCTTLVSAEIYKHRDKDGNWYLGNKPMTILPKKIKPRGQRLSPSSLGKKGFSADIRIYKYVDSKGVVHLTDRPPTRSYKLIYSGKAPALPLALAPNFYGKSYSGMSKKAAEYDGLIQTTAQRYQLDPALLHAVIKTESAYNSDAISPKGAVGLMQLMPAAAKRYGVKDRYDPEDNIGGGARYLRDLLKLFKQDKKLALAAYNAGENAVIRHGNKIPPYKETRYYVAKVIDLYTQYSEAN
jgi:soluble lytic murein transglycosylase-like protein